MIASDGNESVYSNSLMKTARCSLGSMGVVTDVILELAPAVRLHRAENTLDMKMNSDSYQQLLDIALENEHCWIQWIIGDDEDSDEAAAITLSRVVCCDGLVEMYIGRCWYPYSDTMSQMMTRERKRRPGETKRTMQWLFPLTSIGEAIDILKANRLELSSRVVEFKFLASSTLTTSASNSARKGLPAGIPVVALNIWWDLSTLELFEVLEARLSMVPGAKVHYGKWFCRDKAPIAPSLLNESTRRKQVASPLLSVILPVFNAMPWLPIALRDILKQDVRDEQIEVLVGDDASSDGSLEFLVDVALALGERGSIEVVGKDGLVV